MFAAMSRLVATSSLVKTAELESKGRSQEKRKKKKKPSKKKQRESRVKGKVIGITKLLFRLPDVFRFVPIIEGLVDIYLCLAFGLFRAWGVKYEIASVAAHATGVIGSYVGVYLVQGSATPGLSSNVVRA